MIIRNAQIAELDGIYRSKLNRDMLKFLQVELDASVPQSSEDERALIVRDALKDADKLGIRLDKERAAFIVLTLCYRSKVMDDADWAFIKRDISADSKTVYFYERYLRSALPVTSNNPDDAQ